MTQHPLPSTIAFGIPWSAINYCACTHNAEKLCFNADRVSSVTLTHPVLFTQKQKDRLVEAANLAGFAEVTLIEEPVAAVLGYVASGAKAGKDILVYDLGGGTLDLAYVRQDDDGSHYLPIEPTGDACGGDDFDQIVYDHFERQLKSKHGILFGADHGTVNLAILLECRRCKEKLSTMTKARLSSFLPAHGKHFSFDPIRADFETLIRDHVLRTVNLTKAMLQRITSEGHKLDTALLVGGATRIPLIQNELKALLPIPPLETMHADVAVAMGAAFVGKKEVVVQKPELPKKPELPSLKRTAVVAVGPSLDKP